ncbi:MAG: group 1 truncated hemoglobin [Polyangiales bacterium]
MGGEPSASSLFDRMGGEPVLRAVIDDFVDRVFDDMMIGFLFRDVDRARIKQLEHEHASEFLGGPVRYSGRPMRAAHARHRISSGQFGRRLVLLRQAMTAHGVPAEVQQAWLDHNEALRSQVTEPAQSDCRD